MSMGDAATTSPDAGSAVATRSPGPSGTPDEGHAGVRADTLTRTLLDRTGRIAAVVLAAAWVVVLALMLARPVFITHDSLSNNVHVWWIAERLWDGGGLPWRMAPLANGEALTFPYASVPWLTAALAWPLLGDRAVTLWLVAGFVGTVVATFWAFPTLRRGWWAAAVLTNPALVISPLLGQLPFLWSMAFVITGIGFWLRRRTVPAVAVTAVGLVIHPAVMLPIVAVLVLGRLPFEDRDRRSALVGAAATAVLVSLPAVWAVFQSPVVAQSSVERQVRTLVQTSGMRMPTVLVPVALVVLQRTVGGRAASGWTPVAVTAAFVVLQWPMYVPFGMDFAWGSLTRDPPADIDGFAQSGLVRPGDTYRVLSGFDGKYGLYAVVREGGVLDAEFFPEGLHRGGFSSEESFARFLRRRLVDHVVVFPSYAARFRRTNEPQLLGDMAGTGCIEGVTVREDTSGDRWALYRVERC
jgi:hypothetical protein